MTPNVRRTVSWLAIASFVLCSAPRLLWGADAPAPTTRTKWFQVQLEGEAAGWMKATETRKKEADGELIQSDTETSITIRRGPVTIEVATSTRFVENANGKPVSCSSTTKLGMMPGMDTVREMKFRDDGVEVVNRQGDQETKQFVPTPADAKQKAWLPPAASQRYIEAQVAKGEKDIRFWTIDPSQGATPIESRMKIKGEESVEVMGKVVPAIAWTQTISSMPGAEMLAYTDARGEPIKSSVDFGGMNMTLVSADEELAKAKIDPPELLVASMIQPDRPIDSPRTLKKAVYELAIGPAKLAKKSGKAANAGGKNGGEPATLDLPESAAQRVEQPEGKGARARVTVDVAATGKGDAKPGDEFLAATIMLNHKDPRVIEVKDRALKGVDAKASAASKAETLRRFVHGFIEKKDLSVALATASETARTKVGDCTEHAVLLAALLRGAGIPSRTVSGLLYVDEFAGANQVFGYHMWTQAWIDDGKGGGKWVDFDAVLGDDTPFDATHIALVTSAMADGGMHNDMVKVAPLMGRLSIKVIEPAAKAAEKSGEGR